MRRVPSTRREHLAANGCIDEVRRLPDGRFFWRRDGCFVCGSASTERRRQYCFEPNGRTLILRAQFCRRCACLGDAEAFTDHLAAEVARPIRGRNTEVQV